MTLENCPQCSQELITLQSTGRQICRACGWTAEVSRRHSKVPIQRNQSISQPTPKSTPAAYLCWCGCFIYLCGLQRLYLGRTGEGLLYLFTVGIFGIGQLADLFLIPYMVNEKNRVQLMVEEAMRHEQNISQVININIGEEIKSVLASIQQPNVLSREIGDEKQLKPSSTLEIEILKLCKKQGFVTLTDCVIETDSPIEQVEASLNRLMMKNLISVDNHSVDGRVIYKLT